MPPGVMTPCQPLSESLSLIIRRFVWGFVCGLYEIVHSQTEGKSPACRINAMAVDDVRELVGGDVAVVPAASKAPGCL
jgi:hypothetical protein